MAKRKNLQQLQEQKTSNSQKQSQIKSGKVMKGTMSLKPIKRKASSHGFGLGKCPICWDELGTNTRLLASTICGHTYCLHCLQQVLKRKRQCPACRGSLKGSSAFQPLYLDPEGLCPDGEIDCLPYGRQPTREA